MSEQLPTEAERDLADLQDAVWGLKRDNDALIARLQVLAQERDDARSAANTLLVMRGIVEQCRDRAVELKVQAEDSACRAIARAAHLESEVEALRRQLRDRHMAMGVGA